MPRITVSVGQTPLPASAQRDKDGEQIVHSEVVSNLILNDEHASIQALERIAWAVVDAEQMERDQEQERQRREATERQVAA